MLLFHVLLPFTTAKFGEIGSSVIMTKEDGTPKGFAFVNYEEHDSAVKVCSLERLGCSRW